MINSATNPDGSANPNGVAESTLVAGRDVKEFVVTPPMIDVRGWDVLLPDGSKLGTVDRFMLHATDKKLRYLAVTPTDRTGHLLVPIGVGSLELASHQIVLRDFDPGKVEALPRMTSGVVTREFEREVFGAVTGVKVSALPLPECYEDPMYDASELFGAEKKVPKS